MRPARLQSAVALPLVLLSLTACSRGLDSAVFIPAPPLPADEVVRIYRTLTPACPYEELGVVKWTEGAGWTDLQDGVELMRRRAREMGGHAIIGFSLGDQSTGSTRVSADSTGIVLGTTVDNASVASGTVVRFRGDCPADAVR